MTDEMGKQIFFLKTKPMPNGNTNHVLTHISLFPHVDYNTQETCNCKCLKIWVIDSLLQAASKSCWKVVGWSQYRK
jgi:hypothetical protein